MDWVISILSLIVLWSMGNKRWYAPLIGILNQIVWISYAITTDQKGLLFGTIAYLVVHIINAYKWNFKDKHIKLIKKDKPIHKCQESDLKYHSYFCDGLFDLTFYKCKKCKKIATKSEFGLNNKTEGK